MANIDELNQKIESLDETIDNLKKEIDQLKFAISQLREGPDGGIKFLNQEIGYLRGAVESLTKAIQEKR